METFGLTRYLCRAALVLAAVFFVAVPAYAQGGVPGYPESVQAYDPREVALLPKYCIYTQLFRDSVPGGGDQAKLDYWSSTMGKARDGNPMFSAMHHYCWGLMKTNRAIVLTRTTQQARTFYLSDAIGEYDYVIAHAPPTFVLLPEILTKKGENLVRLGRVPQGFQQFEQAIELKPDYWPPYVYMSDHYKGIGDLRKARELLERGLSASPDANALKRRLSELDAGKAKRKDAPQPPAAK